MTVTRRDYREEMFMELANAIMAKGFTVYIAEQGTYGFYTDGTGQRVVSIAVGLETTFSGQYQPSRENGSGWRMDAPNMTKAGLHSALYAHVPSWIRFTEGALKFTTLKQYLEVYQKSSRYRILN